MCFKDDLVFQLIALGIIGYIYTVVEFIIIIPWFGSDTLMGRFHLLLLNSLAVALLYSYFAASFTDPGRPPAHYNPMEGMGEEEMKRNKLKHYCKKCDAYKPPRTHHCSMCNRCVLKMDHHCPWVNNCVGHNNHKNFMLFLFYVVVAIAYAFAMTCWRLTAFFPLESADEYLSPGAAVIVAVALFLMVLVELGVGFLFAFQLNLATKNMTTIESWEFEDAARRARRRGKKVRHTYDLGLAANLRFFFGSRMALWLCPCGAETDGLSYRTYDGEAQGFAAVADWSARARGTDRV
ncbi:palmitoyltransferase PFA4 [Thecamonas trahens ATCC 50062]|uniref:Palmitoyltransferase n=1 Tax=Thecamonas trahens ATCC 50062 TaxID=461836 RepID=A0A0L0DMG0_THETB|nr:palmitoyltransferase PFA4 [Thecamonas trahens ATCC 50062]KNC52563.1 palmitoyltransferase PFA4 [Thecamonas trahens ATCC 50062]|eukprot:XP_013755353.1 palmitoyltransferase PFA4 [Thecamonas trahens ATCC 50062]